MQLTKIFVLLLSSLFAIGIGAAELSPVGLWKSFDEKTGEVTGEIRIIDKDGILSGTIEKEFGAKAKPGRTCTACRDDRKGLTIVGLEVIRGSKKSEANLVWEGGTIIDPDDGTVYKLKLTPIDDGRKLQVRGFVGFSLLGRTQTWVRIE